jgi:hypothetical protein
VALPVQRRLPAALLYRSPALGEPERRGAIAAGLHEVEVLAVGHESVGDAEWLEVDGVPRTLVVEREADTVVAESSAIRRPADASRAAAAPSRAAA